MVAIPRDENRGILLGGVSSSDGTTPVPIYVDPTTHRLYADFTLGTATSGGLDIYRNIDIDESGASQIAKASAGQIYGWYMFNANASIRYVKIYNKATAADENDTPVMTIPLPAQSGSNIHFDTGIEFTTGIALRATTGVADNDTGAPSANDVIVNILYA